MKAYLAVAVGAAVTFGAVRGVAVRVTATPATVAACKYELLSSLLFHVTWLNVAVVVESRAKARPSFTVVDVLVLDRKFIKKLCKIDLLHIGNCPKICLKFGTCDSVGCCGSGKP